MENKLFSKETTAVMPENPAEVPNLFNVIAKVENIESFEWIGNSFYLLTLKIIDSGEWKIIVDVLVNYKSVEGELKVGDQVGGFLFMFCYGQEGEYFFRNSSSH